jgi:UDP-glucose 4-epimerase
MKILVCGSEGRILSHTIPRLIAAGHDVTGVDNCQKWGQPSKPPNYRLVVGDCGDPATLKPLMQGIEGVIQSVATLYGVVGFHERAADILMNDIRAHQTVLQCALDAGVQRVVFLSSSIVYEGSTREPHRENDVDSAVIPRTDYGLSKVTNERICRSLARDYDLPFTIWRPFNVIDPEERATDTAGYSHVFADLIDRIVIQRHNPVEILGDGHQIRSFVHIAEVASAIAEFSFDPRTRNKTYNLGRNEPVTMRGLAARIYLKAVERGMIPDSGPLTFRPREVVHTDVKRRIGSFENIARELAWTSNVTLDESLSDCLTALESRDCLKPSAAQ